MRTVGTICDQHEGTTHTPDEKKAQHDQRGQINRLYFDQQLSKKAIARHLGCSMATVRQWTQSADQDLLKDDRGWPMNQRRHLADDFLDRITDLHEELERDPMEFFSGATAIELRYRQRYGHQDVPSLRSIGRALKQLKLTSVQKPQKRRGATALLCYPEHTVYTQLGPRVGEADFIGPRYLGGSSSPLHFLGISFKKAPRLRQYWRVAGPSAGALIDVCEVFFTEFEKPNLLKVDNCSASVGSISGKRSVSKFMATMWQHEVNPIFSVPRRPFSQASIEGNNSVFSRKFWKQRSFESVEDVDQQLAWFNLASQRYSGYQRPEPEEEPEEQQPFVPRAYYIRQVHQHPEIADRGLITLLNEPIELPQQLINFFVLTIWHPLDAHLQVMIEREEKLVELYSTPFEINPKSKYRP